MHGQGTGHESGITYCGAWARGAPVRCPAAWDLHPPDCVESYVPADSLREEAREQLEPRPSKPEKKTKGEKKLSAAPKDDVSVPPRPQGPELELYIGRKLPEVAVRLIDVEKGPVQEESGRSFAVTMYLERMVSLVEGSELEQVAVRFGDMRKVGDEPHDSGKASPKQPSGKVTPAKSRSSPEPTALPSEDKLPVFEGVESITGTVEGGVALIGGHEAWLIPAHLEPGIYWLRIVDITAGCDRWPKLGHQQIPVRVKLPDG